MNIWRRSSVVERLSHKQDRVSSILTVATRATARIGGFTDAPRGDFGDARAEAGGIEM